MPRMQEAVSREGYDRPKSAVPVGAMLEANAQEQHDRYESRAERELRDHHLTRNAIRWLIRDAVTKTDRTPPTPTLRSKPSNAARESVAKARVGHEALPTSLARGTTSVSTREKRKTESVEAEIRRFQERQDLRACLLPGMLSRISPKACEGWQRQATIRTSRVMTKMKLDSCKNCQYRLKPEAAHD